MPTILITGAGRGLGLELARRFVDLGWETLGTVRDPAKGAAMPKGSQTFLCDSTDRSSLAPAVLAFSAAAKSRSRAL